MLLLGLLLIIAAAAVTAGAVYDGSDQATVEILGRSLDTTIAGVFFAGALTMLVFLLGVWMLSAAAGRSRRKRAERRDVRDRQRDSVARLEEERIALREENDRLAEQLSSRSGAGAGGAAATGAGRTDDASRIRGTGQTDGTDGPYQERTETRTVGHDNDGPQSYSRRVDSDRPQDGDTGRIDLDSGHRQNR